MLRAEPAVKVLCRRELDAAADPDALLREKVEQYREIYLTPYHSASLLVVDAVIHPADTRRRIISALRMLEGKRPPERAWRKHSNIPL